jgi:serine/threonine protein kinase
MPAVEPILSHPRHRYEVLETVGEGASAVVLKARDLELDEVIALKVLAPAVARDPKVVERLKAEIRISRRIRHPNVARVYDLEEWDGRLCISMEYIEGEPLDRRIAHGPVPWPEAAAILLTVALALESAHELGVVHRDLKPANVMLDRLGHPYVLDFGIALGPGTVDPDRGQVVRGSPGYLPPERWRGVPGLPASDLYSLGVLAFEMVSGQPPYRGDTVRVLMSQHLHAPVPSLARKAPGVPAELDALVGRLLAKRPEERPVSATEVVHVLRRVAPRRAPRRPEGDSPRGKVLVVEDEPAVRRLLSEVLHRRGVTVLEAENGLEGIALATAEQPDLVFLDITMPGLDGVSTLRRLKADPALAARPVVMLSGSSDPEHPALSRGLGAVAFLNKPINGDVLDLVLDKYLG